VANMKHYLDFGADSYGRIEISEVVKFDQFGYRLFQDEGRFGRDKTIGAEKADLVFWKGHFQHADATRLGIYGQTVFELTHCFDELIETRKKGFEQIVYYIVSDGVEEFVNGQLDFPESKTDGFSYFSWLCRNTPAPYWSVKETQLSILWILSIRTATRLYRLLSKRC